MILAAFFLAFPLTAAAQLGTISSVPTGNGASGIIRLAPPATGGTGDGFLIKYTYTRKCWECTVRFAMGCSESVPDCNTPTVTEEGYRQFSTAGEAIKWANDPSHDPSQDSLTFISSFVPPQKPLNDFKVVALYRIQNMELKVTVETKQIEQPAKTVTVTHYGVPSK